MCVHQKCLCTTVTLFPMQNEEKCVSVFQTLYFGLISGLLCGFSEVIGLYVIDFQLQVMVLFQLN